MAHVNEDDPTCIVRMISEFRSENLQRRKNLSSHIPTKLQFDSPNLKNNLKRDLSRDDSDISFSEEKKARTNDNSSLVSDCPTETHLIKAELLEAKSKIISLETKISRMHALRMEMELMYESEKRSLIKQQDCERIKTKNLEKQFRKTRLLELAYKDELQEYKSAAEAEKFKLEKKIHMLQKQNFELDDKLKELQMTSHREYRSNERQSSQMECELEEALEEADQLRDVMEQNKERLQQTTEKLHQTEKLELKLQQAELRIKDLESLQELNKEAIEMARTQQHKIFKYPALEKELSLLKEENNNLKECVANKLILEEMVADLKSRQLGLEEREKELVWLQDQKRILDENLEEWRKVAQNYCEVDREGANPISIRTRVEGLQEKVLVLTSEVAQLRSKLKAKEQTLDSLSLSLEKSKKQTEKQQMQNTSQTNLVRRLQKKLLLVSRERDSYRTQLDLYEKELTMTSTNPQFQQQRVRIDTLEKSVEDYRLMLDKLELELEKGSGGLASVELLGRVQELESEKAKLLLEKQQLQQHRNELEQRLEQIALSGKTKVVHLRMNPSAEAEAKRNEELESLRTECNQLRERVKVLEEGHTEDITQQVNQRLATSNSQEVQELREQIKTYELRIQRMLEAFKETSQEVREVCYLLFGYQMDRMQPKIYKLSSMYAENPNDHLLFQMGADSQLHLMETEFSTTLDDLIELHLHQQHSIPMFIGGVTVDLFSRQTMMELSESVLVE